MVTFISPNSRESIELAARLRARFPSWQAVREALKKAKERRSTEVSP